MANILLIDGDSYLVRLYTDMLTQAGHRVSSTARAADVTTLLEGSYDTAFIELGFNFEQGLKLAERLHKTTPVYGLAKAGDSALVQAALKLGIIDILSKPIEGEHLNLLAQRRAAQTKSGISEKVFREGLAVLRT